MGVDNIVGGDMTSLMSAGRPSRGGGEDAYSRAFETAAGGGDSGSGGRRGGHFILDEMPTAGLPGTGVEGPHPYWPQDEFHAYRAQPPSTYQQSSVLPLSSTPIPSDDRHINTSKKGNSAATKTRFPSLAPTLGSFRVSGDARAAEAVARARKTWAPPALRTQAVASYGAVPDLEVIPEDLEVNRFRLNSRPRNQSDRGCPSCTIS